MERKWVEKQFENMGGRVTIRRGTVPMRPATRFSPAASPMRLNVSKDKSGEHFTLTIASDVDERDIIIQVLDRDDKLRQMLLHMKYKDTNEKLLVGHDEMHWFVAGVTMSRTVKEAFSNLRPEAATVAMRRSGVKDKDWRKRKNKGFVRQGEWFFVPVHFKEDKFTVIHKNEPIRRPNGGTAHVVEEVVRRGGETVYTRGDTILTKVEYDKIPDSDKVFYRQQSLGARVLGRGKVKHPDHHTVELDGWHEVHMSTERVSGRNGSMSFNAFLD